jgi:hypothetical protein
MKFSRITQHVVFGLLIIVGFAGSIVTAEPAATTPKASTSTKTAAGGNVQGYASDTPLQNGTIVQLVKDSASKVTPATNKDPKQMFGVTVDPHQLSVTVTDATLPNEAYVAPSGTFNVLVSTQAGPIQSGDYITISAINGVGMQAGVNKVTVLGRAASGFDGKTNALGSLTLKDSTGAAKQVALGSIPVAVNIQMNPNDKSTKANLPKPLQKLGQAIADKPVGPLRIYLSIGITGLSIMVALVTLYSGIRNSIIAIGRNPLGKKTILRGLIEVILASFLILIIGLFAVYLLLKL